MTPKFRLDQDSRVIIRRQAYRNPRPTDDGYTMTSERTGKEVTFNNSRLSAAYAARELRYDYGYYAASTVETRERGAHPEQRQLSKTESQSLAWREAFCRKFLELVDTAQASYCHSSMTNAIPQIQKELANEASSVSPALGKLARLARRASASYDAPSSRTLFRWLKRYARAGVDGLRYGYSRCGNSTPRFPAETRNIMDQFVQRYADERRQTIRECHKQMTGHIDKENKDRRRQGLAELKVPSLLTFSRSVRGQHQFHQYANRHGQQAAIAKFYGGRGGVKVEYLLERCEIDETPLDIFALLTDRRIFETLSQKDRQDIERVRYWLVVIIDRASRYILAIVITRTPSAASGLRALKLAMTDKNDIAADHGAATPWTGGGLIISLFADNGSSFIDSDFRETCALLGVTFVLGPTGRPQFRATIERCFRTLTLNSIANFTGRTFSNVVEKGDYPSEQRATITRDELVTILVRAVVDIYHNTQHRGLRNETPLMAWNRLYQKYGVPPPPNRIQMMTAFGIEYERQTSINGIQFSGLWYHNDELQNYRMRHGDRTVAIRIDVDRLNDIAVKLDKDWVIVPAVDQMAASTTLAQLKAETDYLNKKFYGENKVGRTAAQDARLAFRKIHENALRSADIGPTTLDEAQLHQLTKEVTLGYDIVDDDDQAGSALGDEIPTGAPASQPHTPPPADSKVPPKPGTKSRPAGPSKYSGWRIED